MVGGFEGMYVVVVRGGAFRIVLEQQFERGDGALPAAVREEDARLQIFRAFSADLAYELLSSRFERARIVTVPRLVLSNSGFDVEALPRTGMLFQSGGLRERFAG